MKKIDRVELVKELRLGIEPLSVISKKYGFSGNYITSYIKNTDWILRLWFKVGKQPIPEGATRKAWADKMHQHIVDRLQEYTKKARLFERELIEQFGITWEGLFSKPEPPLWELAAADYELPGEPEKEGDFSIRVPESSFTHYKQVELNLTDEIGASYNKLIQFIKDAEGYGISCETISERTNICCELIHDIVDGHLDNKRFL